MLRIDLRCLHNDTKLYVRILDRNLHKSAPAIYILLQLTDELSVLIVPASCICLLEIILLNVPQIALVQVDLSEHSKNLSFTGGIVVLPRVTRLAYCFRLLLFFRSYKSFP